MRARPPKCATFFPQGRPPGIRGRESTPPGRWRAFEGYGTVGTDFRMQESFFRCAQCGLPHNRGVTQCPTTGMAIDPRPPRRRRYTETHRHRSAEDAAIGRIVDRKYRLTGTLGEGGTSIVYEAERLDSGAKVAIKILHPSLADDADAVARLRHEAELVCALAHTSICAVLDVGRLAEGIPYLVMPRLYGESLAERIERGAVSVAELGPVMLDIVSALEAAHARGIIHRDLKPENVFVEHHGPGAPLTGKLLDFGVAKSILTDPNEHPRFTDTGVVMGTPYYMAPEQARGEVKLDGRVDLWAIGVICYEALSARRPFFANNYNALLVQVLTVEPTPLERLVPDLPIAMFEFVVRAMKKVREHRFQTAAEMREALRPIAASASGEAPLGELGRATSRSQQKRQSRLATTRADAVAAPIRRRERGPPDALGSEFDLVEEHTLQDVLRDDHEWLDEPESESFLPDGFGDEREKDRSPGESEDGETEADTVTTRRRPRDATGEGEGIDTEIIRRS